MRDAVDVIGHVKHMMLASLKAVDGNTLEDWLKSTGTSTGSALQRDHVKWPQKDDRIEKAIRQGTRLNVGLEDINSRHYQCEMYNSSMAQCEAPPRRLATVVTSYYYMKSKHS